MQSKDGSLKIKDLWYKEQLEEIALSEGWEFALSTPKQLGKVLEMTINLDGTEFKTGDKLMWLRDPERDKVITVVVKRSKLKDKKYLNNELMKMLLTMKEDKTYEEAGRNLTGS